MTYDPTQDAELRHEVWPWPSSFAVDQVISAYVKACGAMDDIAKDRKANIEGKDGKKGFTYPYADLASAMEMARPHLAEHGLSVTQPPRMAGRDVEVTTIVLHESGQWISFPPLAMPAGNTAQNTGSAITYARRYSLLPALGVATEDDDGANAGSRDQAPPASEAAPGAGNEAIRVTRLINDAKRVNPPAHADLVLFAATKGKDLTVRALADMDWRREVEAELTRLMDAPVAGDTGVEP